MACVQPLTAWSLAGGGQTWDRNDPDIVGPVYVGCGRCELCVAHRAADCKTRLIQEGYSHDLSICACLTYDEHHVGRLRSLSKRDAQRFIKAVFNLCARRGWPRPRFHLVGEYSPELGRPHYHVILFGFWPPDAEAYSKSRGGNQQMVSELLSKCWEHKGLVTFEDYSVGAATYCAGHQASKLTAARSSFFDHQVRDEAGVVIGLREPEFRSSSRKPALGAEFFEKYGAQMLAHDFTVIDGKEVPLPRFYDKLAKRLDPDRLSELKAERVLAAARQVADQTPERLAVRNVLAGVRRKRMSRGGCE